MNIYLIPAAVPCEKCGLSITTVYLLEIGICPFCDAVQHKEKYGKYFGIIKDIEEVKKDTNHE